MKVHIKRVYEPASKEDGTRILVDRLWPRGLSKEAAQIDLWLKEAAPSTDLRKWFKHEPEKWPEFQKRYEQELSESAEQLSQLNEPLKKGTVTLVYGAKDTVHNDAVVLQNFLKKHVQGR